jgi:hypothetical protein
LPMIAATTPITTAIAIAMHATRTLVWEVIEHRLENSPVSRRGCPDNVPGRPAVDPVRLGRGSR